MPYIDTIYCLYLIPNRWPEGTPLGVRNKLDRTQRWPFMICKSLYDINEIKTKEHSSAKWPPTIVVDMSDNIAANVFQLCDVQLLDYLNAIAFRLLKNIGDFADRNFIRKRDRIYSIDEELTEDSIILLNCLKAKKYNYVKNKYLIHRHLLAEWATTVLDNEFTS